MPVIDISDPLNIRDVHKTPDLPGVYIWYSKFRVGKADWHSDFAGSNINARTALHRALYDHSLKFSQQEMAVKATANFSIEWKGILSEEADSRWGSGLSDKEISSLNKVIDNNDTREAFVDIVDRSFQIFNSPLYLGRATEQTLRERLKQHRKSFTDLWERCARDKEIINRIDKPKNFAERAIKLGFCPDDLFCFTMSIKQLPEDKLNPDQINDLIVAAEWLLNRWATPILGRL